jgi:hypothetical protein
VNRGSISNRSLVHTIDDYDLCRNVLRL